MEERCSPPAALATKTARFRSASARFATRQPAPLLRAGSGDVPAPKRAGRGMRRHGRRVSPQSQVLHEVGVERRQRLAWMAGGGNGPVGIA